MKYATSAAFTKHLQGAFPDHLSSIYLILTRDREESQKLAGELVELMRRAHPDLQQLILRPGSGDYQGALRSGSLLSTHQLVWLHEVEGISAREREELLRFAKSPLPGTTLLMTGAGFKGKDELIDGMKREAVTVDLSEEKPWEQEKRRKEWLFHAAKRAGKQLQPGVVELLIERVGGDMKLLDQELMKLVIYVEGRPEITRRDIELLTPIWTEASLWKLAESLVWTDDYPEPFSRCEIGDLLQIIGALRFQLQQGLLLQRREKSALKPWAEERYAPVALRRPKRFFQEGLVRLCETECALKSGRGAPLLLWESLIAHLTLRKHARSFA